MPRSNSPNHQTNVKHEFVSNTPPRLESDSVPVSSRCSPMSDSSEEMEELISVTGPTSHDKAFKQRTHDRKCKCHQHYHVHQFYQKRMQQGKSVPDHCSLMCDSWESDDSENEQLTLLPTPNDETTKQQLHDNQCTCKQHYQVHNFYDQRIQQCKERIPHLFPPISVCSSDESQHDEHDEKN
jgi:hypothetical protein